jgi:hypothetical protein
LTEICRGCLQSHQKFLRKVHSHLVPCLAHSSSLKVDATCCSETSDIFLSTCTDRIIQEATSRGRAVALPMNPWRWTRMMMAFRRRCQAICYLRPSAPPHHLSYFLSPLPLKLRRGPYRFGVAVAGRDGRTPCVQHERPWPIIRQILSMEGLSRIPRNLRVLSVPAEIPTRYALDIGKNCYTPSSFVDRNQCFRRQLLLPSSGRKAEPTVEKT